MKKGKIAAMAIAAMALVTVTGCGGASKTVTCSTKISCVDMSFTIKYSGNKVKNMGLAYDLDLSSYSDAQISTFEKQDLCPSIKSSFSQYSDGFGNCKQSVKDKHLNVTADINVSKLSKADKDGMASPAKAKEYFEKQGLTCTIK